MSEYEVIGTTPEITLGATGREAILQQVRLVLSTMAGTVPLDRDFGLDLSLLDQPTPRARALLTAEIYAKLRKYVSGIEVTEIDFIQAPADELDGRLVPRVRIKELES